MDPTGKSSASASSSLLKQAVLGAAKTVEQIVDAAEHAADGILAEAQAEAESYLRNRQAEADRIVADRLAEFSGHLEPLRERIEALRDETAGITTDLDRLLRRFARDEPPPAPVRRARSVALAAPTPTADATGSDRALLRATQMAVAGSDRAEIERALRDELRVSDPAPVIDRVLGLG